MERDTPPCPPFPVSLLQNARQRSFLSDLANRARAEKAATDVLAVPGNVLRGRTVVFHPLPLKGEGVEPFRTWQTWKDEGEFEAGK